MTHPRIILLDRSTLDSGDVDLSEVESLGDLQSHAVTAPEKLHDRVARAEIVLTNKVVLDSAAFDAAPRLELVVICATGVNNVDLLAAEERGVTVCNVRGYSTNAVAQHTICLLLNALTSIHRYAAEPGRWAKSPVFTRLDYPVVEADGRVFGIVGVGAIGSRVGEIAEALGMEIQCLAREGSLSSCHPEWPRVEHDAFLGSSDVISLHCPLNAANRHFINAKTLALMKSDAILVNTSRGELVDEKALLYSLENNLVGGAALDVLGTEPPHADHPFLRRDLPNLILTPHSAWSAVEARQRLIDEVAENIASFQAGSPRNVVHA